MKTESNELVVKFEFLDKGALTFLLTANKSTEFGGTSPAFVYDSLQHVHRFGYGKDYTEYTVRDNKNSKGPVPLFQVGVSRLGYIYVVSPEKVQK
ncbi:MAG: hypothetical protein KatS3mg038_2172 [Candidatus Kapaibacterium sp.]|nr:MAG: hypothetical protein KatS3mg038_2172 [Candidatus Kapabacteria bacterium]